jgi:DNA-binding NarL/FixJ family response regulator
VKSWRGITATLLNACRRLLPVRDLGDSDSARRHFDRFRILLADDNQHFRAAIAQFLQPDFEVVKTFGDGQALLEEAGQLNPDIVLLDISMPVLDGIEAARNLKAAGSRAKVVFLTIHADSDHLRAAQAAGAVGYVAKCDLACDLPLAIKEAMAGRAFVSACISRPESVTHILEAGA